MSHQDKAFYADKPLKRKHCLFMLCVAATELSQAITHCYELGSPTQNSMLLPLIHLRATAIQCAPRTTVKTTHKSPDLSVACAPAVLGGAQDYTSVRERQRCQAGKIPFKVLCPCVGLHTGLQNWRLSGAKFAGPGGKLPWHSAAA